MRTIIDRDERHLERSREQQEAIRKHGIDIFRPFLPDEEPEGEYRIIYENNNPKIVKFKSDSDKHQTDKIVKFKNRLELYETFINDYQRIIRIIDNYINNCNISLDDSFWITNLYRKYCNYSEYRFFLSLKGEIDTLLNSKIKIQKCNNCNNVFLKSGKGSGKRKYCSECSWLKNQKEEKKEIYQNICYLIDKWIGREYSRCAKANELTNYLQKIAEREGITDIPFLKDNYNYARSLGQYLRHIKKMLEDEYRIEYHKEKEGSEHTYYLTRIQL
jgi:hypothetical protein